ncbi:hypothetical protein ACN469_07530 [Corallococcus terminator]
MRCMLSRLTYGLVVGVGLMGCGIEDPGATSEEEFQGSVEQHIYNARCQTDHAGYQTGRCLDVLSLNTCQYVPYTSASTNCITGKVHPGGLRALCNIYLNSNYCQDPQEN